MVYIVLCIWHTTICVCYRYLYGFECHGKGKGRGSAVKESPLRGRKRAALSTPTEGAGEVGGALHVEKTRKIETIEEEKSECAISQLSIKKTNGEPSWGESGSPVQDVPPSPSALSVPIRGGVVGGGDSPNRRPDQPELPEKAVSPSAMAGVVSEMSDRESSQGDTTSSTTGEEGEEAGETTWVKRELQRFAENDRVLVRYGSGKNLRMYEAKIIGMEESKDKRDYLVHYSGWNNRCVSVCLFVCLFVLVNSLVLQVQ